MKKEKGKVRIIVVCLLVFCIGFSGYPVDAFADELFVENEETPTAGEVLDFLKFRQAGLEDLCSI